MVGLEVCLSFKALLTLHETAQGNTCVLFMAATEVLVGTMKERRDRLSGLPDDLLVTILRLLPFKSTLTTAVLCQQWRLLWTQLPDIELSLHTDNKGEITDNLLPKFTSPFIRRFSLNLSFYPDSNPFKHGNKNYSGLCSWLDWACQHKDGLQELNFKMEGLWRFYTDMFPNTPLHVFQIPSLLSFNSDPGCVFIQTTILYLGVDGTPDKRQPFWVSFVNPPTAMLAASIGTQTFLPSNLFSLISNMSLTLPSRKTRPGTLLAETTFKQLTHLKFRVYGVFFRFAGAFTDLAFLQQCPGFEVLTFDFTYCRMPRKRRWSRPDSTPQCLITSVKRIEIMECPFVPGFQIVLLRLLNYLLGSSKALELLQINIVAPRYDHFDDTYNELQFINKVFEVPRSSPCCQIEFYGFDHYRLLRNSDTSTGSLLHQ
ncbi:uncharacterized protein LOC141627939 [Silene latifolia]|uniref:uncharacterized protein LOC141627939 n=1 Tax=Silene latifolia TaxID=37657 RepID=UPI003D78938A